MKGNLHWSSDTCKKRGRKHPPIDRGIPKATPKCLVQTGCFAFRKFSIAERISTENETRKLFG